MRVYMLCDYTPKGVYSISFAKSTFAIFVILFAKANNMISVAYSTLKCKSYYNPNALPLSPTPPHSSTSTQVLPHCGACSGPHNGCQTLLFPNSLENDPY